MEKIKYPKDSDLNFFAKDNQNPPVFYGLPKKVVK